VRIAAYAASFFFAVNLFSAPGVSQNADKSAATKGNVFATAHCFSKGGLGIVNTNLYIVVKSQRNQLLYNKTDPWTGLDAARPEIAVFFDYRVWAPQALPKAFDLSKAVVVSFEGSKVRFFNFQDMSGCYYDRMSD
jgi:hypothetical protein